MTAKTKLTMKQRHYTRCRASGLNMTDSYKESYSCNNMQNSTINEAASRLDKDQRINARIEQLISLKDKALIRSTVGLRSKVLTKLVDLMETATPQDSGKIRATELLGKSIGLFKDVIEDNRDNDKTAEELTTILEAKLLELSQRHDKTAIN